MTIHFDGIVIECAEALAEVDAELGFPRTYTTADLLDGTVRRRGDGPWAPVETLYTTSASSVEPIDVDENGVPTSDRRRVRVELDPPTVRTVIARKRVLRVVNRGAVGRLVAAGLTGPQAAAIVSARGGGRLTSLDGVLTVSGLPSAATARGALLAHAAGLASDDEDDNQEDAAPAQASLVAVQARSKSATIRG